MHFLYGSVPSVCTQLVDCKPRESANRKLSLPLQRSKALWTAGTLYTEITYCDTHSIWAVPQYRSQLFLACTSVVLSKSPSLTCGTVPHQMYQVINSLESLRWKSRAGEKDSLVYMPHCRRDIQLIIILLGILWIAKGAKFCFRISFNFMLFFSLNKFGNKSLYPQIWIKLLHYITTFLFLTNQSYCKKK